MHEILGQSASDGLAAAVPRRYSSAVAQAADDPGSHVTLSSSMEMGHPAEAQWRF
jgi:hypothetical protein